MNKANKDLVKYTENLIWKKKNLKIILIHHFMKLSRTSLKKIDFLKIQKII
jgi:hypothetical protein